MDLSSPRSSLSLHLKCDGAPARLLTQIFSSDRGGLEWVLPAMEATLLENKISFAEIKHWFLPDGPGSFTGLRIGAATLKGILLAYPTAVSVMSSLEARVLAFQADHPQTKGLATYPLGRDQVASGHFEKNQWTARVCSEQELKMHGKGSVTLLTAPSLCFERAQVFELQARHLAENFTHSQTVKTFWEADAWIKFQPQYWGDTRFGK